MHDKSRAWLQKQLKEKQTVLERAEKRPGVTTKELDDIKETIQVIKHLLFCLGGITHGTARAGG